MDNYKIENTGANVVPPLLNSTLNFHRGHFTVPSNYSATPLIQRDGKICQHTEFRRKGEEISLRTSGSLAPPDVNDFHDR